MSATVQDLLQPLTATQIRATMVFALKTLGVPADQWRKRGALSTMLTVVSMIFAMFGQVIAAAYAAGFLETATGGWLRVLAVYVYGIDPSTLVATFASGTLTLINSGGSSYTRSARTVTFSDSSSKQQYTNENDFSLAPNSNLDIDIVALIAGSSGSAPPGAVDTIVTSMLGVSCTNNEAVVGLDSPDDPTVRALCMNRLGAMSVRGPRTAYAYAIQTATNSVTGAPVNINRWTITPSSHTGQVSVVVASPSGVPDPNDVAGVVNNIEAIARPDAVTVSVSGAIVQPYTATITVYAQALAGLAASDLQTEIAQALAIAFSQYPIRGYAKPSTGVSGVWASGVDGIIKAVSNAIFDVDGTFDMPLLPGVVAGDATTVNVVLVPGVS